MQLWNCGIMEIQNHRIKLPQFKSLLKRTL